MLTRVENCGLQDERAALPSPLCFSPRLSLILQPNQWFSCGQECAGGNSVSMLQRCADPQGKAPGLEGDCQRTDLSTLASVSDNRNTNSTGVVSAVEALLSKVNEGLTRKIAPLKNGLGTSGVYTMRDGRRNVVGIFKPIDEEPTIKGSSGDLSLDKRHSRALSCDVAKINDSLEPRRSIQERRKLAPRMGLYAGELCLREVAAYLLDSEGLHGVPATAMAQIPNNLLPASQQKSSESFRVGSLQRFVQNNGVTSNISCSKFSVFEVQKIALLDLRILNSDRNEANILFKRDLNDRISLIPIDHALSMPDKLEVYQSDLCWLDWPQSREPLCPELADFVARMNPEKDAELVKSRVGIRDECTLNLRIAEVFLKKAAAKGLSLAKIAQMMYRAKEFSKSPLEKLVEKTRLTYDFLLRKADMIPAGIMLSAKAQVKEAKMLFTPQKLHNRLATKLPPVDLCRPHENLECTPKPGFLTPIKSSSSKFCPMPLSIFPSYCLQSNAKLQEPLHSNVLSPLDANSPSLDADSFPVPEVPHFCLPTNDFQMPNDLPDCQSTSSNPWDALQAPDLPLNPCHLPLLEAISCGPRQIKSRTRKARQTTHPDYCVRSAGTTRSATQERRGHQSKDLRERLCFLPNVKTSEQSLLELFFECFELNVSRFLDEKARKVPRKYTMHVG